MVERRYKCKKCGKLYKYHKNCLPIDCGKCGTELVTKKYGYNLITNCKGETLETRDTNMFGGYDYLRVELSDDVEAVKVKRKLFGWQEMRIE